MLVFLVSFILDLNTFVLSSLVGLLEEASVALFYLQMTTHLQCIFYLIFNYYYVFVVHAAIFHKPLIIIHNTQVIFLDFMQKVLL